MPDVFKARGSTELRAENSGRTGSKKGWGASAYGLSRAPRYGGMFELNRTELSSRRDCNNEGYRMTGAWPAVTC